MATAHPGRPSHFRASTSRCSRIACEGDTSPPVARSHVGCTEKKRKKIALVPQSATCSTRPVKNVPSPCTGVCRIENASGHCLGCNGRDRRLAVAFGSGKTGGSGEAERSHCLLSQRGPGTRIGPKPLQLSLFHCTVCASPRFTSRRKEARASRSTSTLRRAAASCRKGAGRRISAS